MNVIYMLHGFLAKPLETLQWGSIPFHLLIISLKKAPDRIGAIFLKWHGQPATPFNYKELVEQLYEQMNEDFSDNHDVYADTIPDIATKYDGEQDSNQAAKQDDILIEKDVDKKEDIEGEEYSADDKRPADAVSLERTRHVLTNYRSFIEFLRMGDDFLDLSSKDRILLPLTQELNNWNMNGEERIGYEEQGFPILKFTINNKKDAIGFFNKFAADYVLPLKSRNYENNVELIVKHTLYSVRQGFRAARILRNGDENHFVHCNEKEVQRIIDLIMLDRYSLDGGHEKNVKALLEQANAIDRRRKEDNGRFDIVAISGADKRPIVVAEIKLWRAGKVDLMRPVDPQRRTTDFINDIWRMSVCSSTKLNSSSIRLCLAAYDILVADDKPDSYQKLDQKIDENNSKIIDELDKYYVDIWKKPDQYRSGKIDIEQLREKPIVVLDNGRKYLWTVVIYTFSKNPE